MSRYIVWAIAAVVFAIAVFVLEPSSFRTATRPGGPAGLVGESAPVFRLRDDRGSRVSLSGIAAASCLMNLWASWCPPCRAEMPDLQRLATAPTRERDRDRRRKRRRVVPARSCIRRFARHSLSGLDRRRPAIRANVRRARPSDDDRSRPARNRRSRLRRRADLHADGVGRTPAARFALSGLRAAALAVAAAAVVEIALPGERSITLAGTTCARRARRGQRSPPAGG